MLWRMSAGISRGDVGNHVHPPKHWRRPVSVRRGKACWSRIGSVYVHSSGAQKVRLPPVSVAMGPIWFRIGSNYSCNRILLVALPGAWRSPTINRSAILTYNGTHALQSAETQL